MHVATAAAFILRGYRGVKAVSPAKIVWVAGRLMVAVVRPAMVVERGGKRSKGAIPAAICWMAATCRIGSVALVLSCTRTHPLSHLWHLEA